MVSGIHWGSWSHGVPADERGQLYPDESVEPHQILSEKGQWEEVGTSTGWRNALTFKQIYISVSLFF